MYRKVDPMNCPVDTIVFTEEEKATVFKDFPKEAFKTVNWAGRCPDGIYRQLMDYDVFNMRFAHKLGLSYPEFTELMLREGIWKEYVSD